MIAKIGDFNWEDSEFEDKKIRRLKLRKKDWSFEDNIQSLAGVLRTGAGDLRAN